MAFDIRPSAAASSNKSRPLSSTDASSSKSSSASTDLFSAQLAATTSTKTVPSDPHGPSDKTAPDPAVDVAIGNTLETPSVPVPRTGDLAAAERPAPKLPAPELPASMLPASELPAPKLPTPELPVAEMVLGKSRFPTRGAAANTHASQAPNLQSLGDAIADPSADAANASALSLLQLLAQSLEGPDSAAPSTDTVSPDATDATEKSADDVHDAASDPSSALAVFTQALAAALGGSTAAPGAATLAAQGTSSNASPAAADSVTEGVTDATRSSNGSYLQGLVSLVAQDVVADAKDPIDALESGAIGTRSASDDTSAANTATGGANTVAQSLAHLGVGSHFALQPQNELHTHELRSPVGSAAWSDELGTHLTWMTHRGLESGSLRLSPEHLGPVEVQISVQNGDASVWFGASHPDARAALQQALPRLREMFATQGLTLTDSGVSRESPRNPARSAAPSSVAAVSAVGGSEVTASSVVRLRLGLIDTYV